MDEQIKEQAATASRALWMYWNLLLKTIARECASLLMTTVLPNGEISDISVSMFAKDWHADSGVSLDVMTFG